MLDPKKDLEIRRKIQEIDGQVQKRKYSIGQLEREKKDNKQQIQREYEEIKKMEKQSDDLKRQLLSMR